MDSKQQKSQIKLLIATDNRYWRKSLGSQQRISSLVAYLETQDIDITVFFIGNYYENDMTMINNSGIKQFTQDDIEFKTTPDLRIRKLTLAIKFRLKKMAYALVDFLRFGAVDTSPTPEAYINLKAKFAFQGLVNKTKPDAILIEFVRLAYLVDGLVVKASKQPSLFLDTHDVSYLRHENFKLAGKTSDLRVTKKQEASLLNNFDHLLAIQLEDCKQLAAISNKSIIHTPHAIQPMPSERIETPIDSDYLEIGFIGSAMAPNIHGVKTFINEVLVNLKEVRLHLFGGVCKDIKSDNHSVIVHGYIDDLSQAYGMCHIMINPVTFGGGLKIKSVEALAHGKPLVSTEEGVKGMPVSEAFLICGNTEDWSSAINRLKQHDYRHLMENKALAYATAYYSHEAAYAPFLSELKKV